MVLAKELLEQCAKEVGEAYTNRRVISSADPLNGAREDPRLHPRAAGHADRHG
jgi:hypothetical protein